MDDEIVSSEQAGNEVRIPDVVYNPEKDFYKGMGGELRFKAEGLFKKAREKGISIEEIEVATLKEGQVEFPGIGVVALPAYFVKIRGKHLQSGQVLADGKQIDYYNIYQQYIAQRIEKKNILRDERGRVIRDNNKAAVKDEPEFTLTDWELFEVGRSILDDKEFGMEKTITGACDRVIRKLMGENDWLHPGEARMLDEEFSSVQGRIEAEQESSRVTAAAAPVKKATERQINYLKAKIKNLGADPDDDIVMKEILKQSGFDTADVGSLSTGDMSRVIDSVNIVVPKVKEAISRRRNISAFNQGNTAEARENIKQ